MAAQVQSGKLAQFLQDRQYMEDRVEAGRLCGGRMACGNKTWDIVVISIATPIAAFGAIIFFGALNLGTLGLPLMIVGAIAAAVVVGMVIKMIVQACIESAIEKEQLLFLRK